MTFCRSHFHYIRLPGTQGIHFGKYVLYNHISHDYFEKCVILIHVFSLHQVNKQYSEEKKNMENAC